MRETEKIMALCDSEEEYAQLMTEFLKKQKDLPWEIRTYTSYQELMKEEKGLFVMLVVSESAYCEEMELMCPLRLVILNESGKVPWPNRIYVDKYQPAEEVLRSLLQIYMEVEDVHLPRLIRQYETIFLGHYSPVKRCRQTSFALTMSQILSKNHATLYLNFEYYAGMGELLPNMQTNDMADLLFFMGKDIEKFRLKMQTIRKKLGNLDYVPPMKSGQNLLTIAQEEWIGLLQKIEELGEYEYVVLDLSDSIQGVFDILRLCKKVYTVVGEDRVAQSKLLQYEQLLTLCDYEDVLNKTERFSLSCIQRIPEELEQLTKGELASLVTKLLEGM